jgi:hypothetical protein
MSTLKEIRDLVLESVDLPPEGDSCPVPVGLLNRWANQAWQEVFQAIVKACPDWLTKEKSIALDPSEQKYNLPDCYKILKVLLKNGQIYVNLEQWNYDSLDILKTIQPNTNYIMKYRLLDNKLWLHRTPVSGDSLLVYYIPKPRILRSASDSLDIDIPWNWEDAVVSKVASKCCTKLELPAQDFDKEYSLAMENLKEKANERDQGSAVMIVDAYRGFVL